MTSTTPPPASDTGIIGVFEGGGVKGIGLAGAAAAAMDCGFAFERVVGTSAGAMVGALIQAGFGSKELRQSVCDVDWPGLLDPHPLARLPGIGKHLAVFFHQGVNRGDRLEEVWADMLSSKNVRTFGDLIGPLRIVATDLTHTRGVVFPDDFDRYGMPADTTVAGAVRISAAVPFLFSPVRRTATSHEVILSDGAMAANFPMRIVDFAAGLPIIGFRFAEPDHIVDHRRVRGPISFAAAVMRAGVGARKALPAGQLGDVTNIRIPVWVDPLDFRLSRTEAADLFDTGYSAARPQFEALRTSGKSVSG